jgi:hypothetical protein
LMWAYEAEAGGFGGEGGGYLGWVCWMCDRTPDILREQCLVIN